MTNTSTSSTVVHFLNKIFEYLEISVVIPEKHTSEFVYPHTISKEWISLFLLLSSFLPR